MRWHGRKPRTKFDPANTLLDMGYTILFHILEAHLRLYGFDIYCGVYHQFFYERKSLVCDLVEPFRCLVDRALRNAHGLGQIDENDFDICGHQYLLPWKNGGKYARIFTDAILERKEDIFRYVQSYYRCFIRHETDSLPVFLSKTSCFLLPTIFKTTNYERNFLNFSNNMVGVCNILFLNSRAVNEF